MTLFGELSKERTRWDAFILLLVIVSVLIIPFQFALVHKVTSSGSVVIYMIDLAFLANLFINLRTRVHHPNSQKGLLTDLLASLPVDALFLIWPDIEPGGISMVLWLRLFRLSRLIYIIEILKRWQGQHWVHPGYLRIARFSSVILFFSHLVSCAWYLTAFFSGFPPNSWIVLEGIRDADQGTAYLRSLYWTITTLTTVGFGDITPHLNYEYVFAILTMIMGASMYAFIIGNLASIIRNMDVQKSNFLNQVDSIKLYLRYRGIPDHLNERVRNYYDYRWKNHRGLDEQHMLNDLPEPLRLDVMMELTRELLEKVQLFKHSSPSLRKLLLLSLQAKTFDPGSMIASAEEFSDGIVFISKGTVEIVKSDRGEAIESLSDGEYFGDLPLLLGERRTAGIRALTFCETFILYGTDFTRIKETHPEFKEVMKLVSEEKTRKRTELMLKGIMV